MQHFHLTFGHYGQIWNPLYKLYNNAMFTYNGTYSKGSRKKSVFLVVGPLRPLPPPLGLVVIGTFL